MKYCYHCGYQLVIGNEQFCPDCGKKLEQNVVKGTTMADKRGSMDISNTSDSVIGTGSTGSGNIFGKEVQYTFNGPVFQISGNVPREVLDILQRMMTISTQIEQKATISKEDITAKLEESSTSHQQIRNVLDDVNKIQEKTGTEIKQIKAGDLQISKTELSLKEIILKGNEHYYKNEYNEAISWYDKAIKINPNYADAWDNKGNVLIDLGRYNEALECSNETIRLGTTNMSITWSNKGSSLAKLGKYDEAIKCYDKAIKINPNYALAWSNKGSVLNNLGKYEEAIKYYDKAIELNPDYADAWNNKGYSLNNLGKYQEAIECYDKALEINPNYTLAQNNKNIVLDKQKKGKKKG